MFRLCQTARPRPCREVKLKLEAIGTFWMVPSCSQKVSWLPRWVRIAELLLHIRESTNWHSHSPVKNPSNANRKKYGGKIEGPFFLLLPSHPGTVCSADYRHCGSTGGRLFRTCRSCRTCYSSHHLQRAEGKVPPGYHVSLLLEGISISAMTECLLCSWKRL